MWKLCGYIGTLLIWRIIPFFGYFLESRLFRGSRGGHGEIISVPNGGDEKREHGSARKSGPLLSGIAYCISSCSMILLNKVVLSGYNFNAGVSLMFYQVCIVMPFQPTFFDKDETRTRVLIFLR